MDKYELFIFIYYWLDNYYKNTTDELIINLLSDMNPFVWKEECSADPAYYDEYCLFIKDRIITIENSFAIAAEYVSLIDYVDVTEAFDNKYSDEWKEGLYSRGR